MLKNRQIILIFLPAILIAAFALFWRVNQNKTLFPSSEDLSNYGSDLISISPNDPYIGERGAAIPVIAFMDFACDACQEQMGFLEALTEKYPNKIKMVWKGLSVSRFPQSTEKLHLQGYCANEQGKFALWQKKAFAKYLKITDNTLNDLAQTAGLDQNKLKKCLESGKAEKYLNEVSNLANQFNIQTVPTFFVNNKQIATPDSLNQWEDFLRLK